jgi:molybdopterin synthase catalytic subunit
MGTFRIIAEPIDVREVMATVIEEASGAVDLFVGTTRNHSHGRSVQKLDYEAYPPMALKMMEQIELEARTRWQFHNAAIVHRIGTVPVGEPSVVIAVSSSHREEAFQACRFMIDRLKEIVPIWKKEYFSDGTVEWSHQIHEQNIAPNRPA